MVIGTASGRLSWTAAADISASEYVVEISPNDGVSWETLGITRSTSFEITGLTTGNYDFSVRSKSPAGTLSNRILVQNETIQLKTVGKVAVIYADTASEWSNTQRYSLTTQEYVSYYPYEGELPSLPITSGISFTRFIGADGADGSPTWNNASIYLDGLDNSPDTTGELFLHTSLSGSTRLTDNIAWPNTAAITLKEVGFLSSDSGGSGVNNNKDALLSLISGVGGTIVMWYSNDNWANYRIDASTAVYNSAAGYFSFNLEILSAKGIYQRDEFYTIGLTTGADGADGTNAFPTGSESATYAYSTDITPDQPGRLYIRSDSGHAVLATGPWPDTPLYVRFDWDGVGQTGDTNKESLERLGASLGQFNIVIDNDNWVTYKIDTWTPVTINYGYFDVTATLVNSLGSYVSGVNQTISWTAPGATGSRGPGWWRYETGGPATTVNLSNQQLSAYFSAATGFDLLSETAGDRFIVVNNSDEASAYIRNNNNDSWTAQAEFIDGNFLVSGTVSSEAISTNAITANKIQASANTDAIYSTPPSVGVSGTLASGATGLYLNGDHSRLEVFENGKLRVALGNLQFLPNNV